MLLTLFLGCLILFMIWKLISQEAHPVDQLPGPPRLPVIGNALSFIGLNKEQMFTTLRKFVRDYGDCFIVKIFRRRIVHINAPDKIEIVLSHSKNISKSYPYSFLQPWLGTGLLLSTGSKWHRRRKILTPTFHFNILKNFSSVIEERCRDLVTRLREREETLVNVTSVISDFTLYTICETAMGTRLDSDKSDVAVQYKTAILSIGELAMKRLVTFWLHFNLIFDNSKPGREFHRALAAVHSFADNVILERKNARTKAVDQNAGEGTDEDLGTKKRLAMMDLLLDAESKGEIDLEGIREEVNTFMFEGHDTTAMALTFALMLLADHEEVQDKIYDEIRSVFGESDRTPSMADLADMKYLEAVIKETLRLYPSVPFIARTITEDFMMGDLKIKKGTEVAIHIYDLHRRPDIYPDPEKFDPERFLQGGPKHPYAFVPFSAGPRNCIGQKFAMQEMKCALSEICRSFHLAAVTPGHKPTLAADMVLRPAEPIYVKFIER